MQVYVLTSAIEYVNGYERRDKFNVVGSYATPELAWAKAKSEYNAVGYCESEDDVEFIAKSSITLTKYVEGVEDRVYKWRILDCTVEQEVANGMVK